MKFLTLPILRKILAKKILISLGFLILSAVFAIFVAHKENKIIVISHQTYFENGQILSPQNLRYTQEYYLLENLGAGLVYENWRNLAVWEPRLAERWEQISPYQWIFYLRPSLLWSDGSPMSPEQIVAHFDNYRSVKFRHISLLAKLASVSYEQSKHALVFSFKDPVHEGLLHELSLADAVILHPRNLQDDWSLSSGAYYVKTRTHDVLTLEANPFFIQVPQIKKIEIHPSNFKRKMFFDIWKKPIFSYRPEVREVISKANVFWSGYPTNVYYFYFTAKDPRAYDREVRRAFAVFVNQAFTNFEHPLFVRDQQMIPAGYIGRLDKGPSFEGVEIAKLLGINFTIEMDPMWKSLIPEFLDKAAKIRQLDMKITFGSSESLPLVSTLNFIGNQRDPLSSWQYLYGSEGPMHHFFPEVKNIMDAITRTTGEQRKQLLIDLHRKTLEEAYLVPFIAEYDGLLASDRVDLSAINPFDMRLRFFEMKWN